MSYTSILRCRMRAGMAAALAIGACAVASARATTVTHVLSEEELVAQAGFVVVGTVARLESAWNATHTQIYTTVDIDVERTLKGTLQNRAIQIRILGGEAEGIGMAIPDGPAFAAEQEVVLFLNPNPQTLFPVVGFNQGKFTVTVDAATGRKMVAERNQPLDTFAHEVQTLAEVQALQKAGAGESGPEPLQPKAVRP